MDVTRALIRLLAALLATAALTVVPPAGASSVDPPLPAELAGLPQLRTSYGGAVTLQYPNDPPDFETPVLCGELGCTYHGISWGLPPGSAPTAGCTPQSVTCTFEYRPFGNGDRDEAWKRVTVAHMVGGVTYDSTSYALLGEVSSYLVYPDLWFPDADDPDRFGGKWLFLVRAGASPDVSQCAGSFPGAGNSTDYDCFVEYGSSSAAVLPSGSSWNVLGSLTKPATGSVRAIGGVGFDTASFTIAGDNINLARVNHAKRPVLQASISVPSTIAVGQTVDATVTITAANGTAGRVENIQLQDPLFTYNAYRFSIDPVITVGGSVPGPFDLANGASQSFTVPITGTAAGSTYLWTGTAADGNAVTDEGIARSSTMSPIRITVTGDDPTPDPTDPPTDPVTAPEAPTVLSAVAGASGVVTSSVRGAPGAQSTVDLVAATGPACPQQLSGAGVRSLGSTTVTIPASGTAAFTVVGGLGGGEWVYGTQTAAGVRSAISACLAAAAAPTTVAAAVKPRKVKRGKKATVTIAVSAATGAPTGSVVVRYGKKTLTTVALAGGVAKVKVPTKAIKPGRRKLTVSYQGDASYAPASTTLPLKVTPPR